MLSPVLLGGEWSDRFSVGATWVAGRVLVVGLGLVCMEVIIKEFMKRGREERKRSPWMGTENLGVKRKEYCVGIQGGREF